jgi:hypothetical protein
MVLIRIFYWHIFLNQSGFSIRIQLDQLFNKLERGEKASLWLYIARNPPKGSTILYKWCPTDEFHHQGKN